MKAKRILLLSLTVLVVPALLLIPRLMPKKPTISGETFEAGEFILGTIVKIKLYDAPPEGLFEDIFEEIRGYEGLLSLNIAESDINRINRAAGVEPVTVDPVSLAVIGEGLRYSRLSEGRFDITIGPLVNLWRIGYDDARIPAPEEIARALPLINHREVILDADGGTVYLRRRGMEMDLGAIAKGFIADRIAETLRAGGIERGIINLGGNVLTLGAKPGNQPFRIGIQNPWELRGQSAGILELKNLSLVSSGDYERFFEEGGKRYHHILDSDTGYPAENSLTQVTIISPRSVDGDGLSTSVFAMGLDKGYRLITSLEGIEAVFITKDKSVYLTPGVEKLYNPANSDFTVKSWGE